MGGLAKHVRYFDFRDFRVARLEGIQAHLVDFEGRVGNLNVGGRRRGLSPLESSLLLGHAACLCRDAERVLFVFICVGRSWPRASMFLVLAGGHRHGKRHTL